MGAELDGAPEQSYELAAMPRTVAVEGSAGYHHVFTVEELAARVRAVGQQRPRGDP